jgi:RNA polymerase sigma factor (sigma-70 family)
MFVLFPSDKPVENLPIVLRAKIRSIGTDNLRAMAGKTTISRGSTQASFDKTQWTEILIAAGQQATGATQALESLCSKYRPPLYAFIRAQGRSRSDADDLVQGFFLHLLAKDRLRQVNPGKGRFRSFLLACLTNYLRNQWDKDHAQRRGSGQAHFPIKSSDTETGEGVAPRDSNDPQREFEREWASTLIREVIHQLKTHYQKSGRGEIFEILHPLLAGEGEHGQGNKAAAAKLALTENAVRQAVHRLRRDYRQLLLAEVGRTVESPSEVEDEVRYLFSVFQTR